MAKPIISKDHFISCIEVLQQLDDMASEINKTARKYGRKDFIDGYAFGDSECESKLVETLELALGDKEHWVSWFVYEADYGRDEDITAMVTVGDKIMAITDAATLYDYLTNQ